MRIQERDSKGRFSGIRDTEIDAMIAAEDEQAQKFIKMCDCLGFNSEGFGIKKMESGNWRIDRDVKSTTLGLALAFAVALDQPREKIVEFLRSVCDALGITEKMRKNENLQKQRRQVVL